MNTHTSFSLLLLIFLFGCAQGQEKSDPLEYSLIGGPCEGCEAVLEYTDQSLSPIDTLPGFQKGNTPLRIHGQIFMPDGHTPAANTILYIYHTNEKGVYPTKGDESGWAKRHGYHRGWIRTDTNGEYAFYTFQPGAYPSRNNPAHIHATILEPDGKYYYISEYLFEGDSLLSEQFLKEAPRGGHDPILELEKERGLFVAERNITLGKHVPGY